MPRFPCCEAMVRGKDKIPYVKINGFSAMEGKDKFCAQITKYDLLPGNTIMFVKQRKIKAKHREQNFSSLSD